MKTIVKFRLSGEGRKAALLAGLCADEYQTIEVAADAPEFREVVAAGKIGEDVCEVECCYAQQWGHVPTVREILSDLAQRASEKAADEAAKRSAALAEISEVFAARRTVTRAGSYGYGATEAKYETRQAAWPQSDMYAAELLPETAAWVAELSTTNAAAKAAAEKLSGELKAAKEAADAADKTAKAQAETERRAALGLQDGEFDYAVEGGAIMRVPCYDTGRRSKNWMATITVDANKPGGLDRDFAAKAHGDAFYILPTLSPGDALEFGADSYSARGRKSPERAYRFVVRVEVTNGNGYIVLRKCKTGKEACREGAKFAEKLATATAVATA